MHGIQKNSAIRDQVLKTERKFITLLCIKKTRENYFTSAMTSISTKASLGNRATSTQERAGL